MAHSIPPAQLNALRSFANAYGRLLSLAASAIEHGHLPEKMVHAAIAGHDFERGDTLRRIGMQRRRVRDRMREAANVGVTLNVLNGRGRAIHASVQEEWELALPVPDLR